MLPVTPETFTVETGNNIQMISIHQLGDVNLWGAAQPLYDYGQLFFPVGEPELRFFRRVHRQPPTGR